MRFTKRVVAQGHVTIPSDLRSALDIDAGDLVEFEIVGVIQRASATDRSPPAEPAARPRPSPT